MGHIALLSEDLINKIAAGEVVERPASVVKELVENAVDAQARNIHVSLREGGLSFISVSDDGHGMGPEDARLAMSRHATSKLKDVDGLLQIQTKGFRGEALPAIASVSRFSLTTAEKGASVGTRLFVEGGSWGPVDEVAATQGTTITVEDLFYAVPARRKFMRREQTELSHAEEALIRIALAHPDIGFFLTHEERELFSSPACNHDMKERIAATLGKQAYPHLVPVDERWLGIRVHGFVATAEYTLPTARGLYCFVNQRYIRDRGLNHAVQRGYLDTLPPGRQPVVVLFLEIDPSAVDVNVHPQKLEVRFTDSKGIYDAVYATVSKAIRAATKGHQEETLGVSELLPGAQYAMAVDRFLTRAQADVSNFNRPTHEEHLTSPTIWAEIGGKSLGFGQARPGLNDAQPKGFFRSLQFLGVLGKTFWVCEAEGGTLVVVDPHAARERLLLNELWQGNSIPSKQDSLFSKAIELSEAHFTVLCAHQTLLRQWGLGFEPFGGNSIRLEAGPAWLAEADWSAVMVQMAEILTDGSASEFSQQEKCYQLLACSGATASAPHRLCTSEEFQSIFSGLDTAAFEHVCRHARIVLSQTPFLELKSRASRSF